MGALAAFAALAIAVLSGAVGGGDPDSADGSGLEAAEQDPSAERDVGSAEGGEEQTPADATTYELGDAEPFTDPVPILMYHEIGPAPPDNPYPELFVSFGEFKDQLRWLDDNGYEPVTLEALELGWRGKARLPEKPVVISFDDGLRGQYDRALPKLEKRGWPAVLFLKVDALTQGELTEEMVEEMLAAGWELGSHTITHADLAAANASQLVEELEGSRRELRKRFGVPVDFFCYPAGSYDDEAVAAVEAAGYRGAVTVEPGFAEPGGDPFLMPRIRVAGGAGSGGLAADLG